MGAPELWWNAEHGVIMRVGVVDRIDYGWNVLGAADRWLDELPDNAVPLVPAEPVDEKGRGESYRRGFADGQIAERAGTAEDVVEVRRWPGDEVLRVDPPPFAPELADAPLVVGESGAPAPSVVDQPVQDSTLPEEASRYVAVNCAGCGARIIAEPDRYGRIVDVGGCGIATPVPTTGRTDA